MPFDVKPLALAVTLLLAGVEAAQAWERTPAPIEFARRMARPTRDETARVQPASLQRTAASNAPARRAVAASLDQPDILYGYGRVSRHSDRMPLDLRGTLRTASSAEALADDAFDTAAPDGTLATAEAAYPVAAPTEVASADMSGGAAETPAVSRDGAYYVQVGAFSDPANAERARAALCDVGPVTVDMRQGSAVPLHRVRLGQWPSRAEAELAREMIVARGFTGAVVAGGR